MDSDLLNALKDYKRYAADGYNIANKNLNSIYDNLETFNSDINSVLECI